MAIHHLCLVSEWGCLISAANWHFLLAPVFMPPPFSIGGGRGGGGVGVGVVGGAYSITAVRTTSVRPVRNTFGFHAISFERIGVLD